MQHYRHRLGLGRAHTAEDPPADLYGLPVLPPDGPVPRPAPAAPGHLAQPPGSGTAAGGRPVADPAASAGPGALADSAASAGPRPAADPAQPSRGALRRGGPSPALVWLGAAGAVVATAASAAVYFTVL